MIHDYVIELPWLEGIIDFEALKANYPYHLNDNDPWRGVQCYHVTYDQKEVRDFMDKFHDNPNWSNAPTYWLTHSLKDAWLSPHIDELRDATVIFPIEPKTHTIHFLENLDDENSIIYSHDYKSPCMPHAKLPHMVKDKEVDRWFFQISYHIKDYSWKRVNELISSKAILSID